MFETNVIGTLRVTKALLPALIASGDGHIVTVTSIAALETYDNGAGYTGAKHAQAMLHRTLRGELLGQPVRLTEILPGMVETDFSLVRFDGDAERAAQVYRGHHPADRRGRGRRDRVRGHPAQPRQPGPDRAQTPGPGQRDPRLPLGGVGAVQSADRPVHWSQLRVQSQMSPSWADSSTGVPVTSTGSP